MDDGLCCRDVDLGENEMGVVIVVERGRRCVGLI